jgi:hypothetical protein
MGDKMNNGEIGTALEIAELFGDSRKNVCAYGRRNNIKSVFTQGYKIGKFKDCPGAEMPIGQDPDEILGITKIAKLIGVDLEAAQKHRTDNDIIADCPYPAYRLAHYANYLEDNPHLKTVPAQKKNNDIGFTKKLNNYGLKVHRLKIQRI